MRVTRQLKCLCRGLSLSVLSLCTAGVIMAEEYYVAPDGSDDNPGSLQQPFKSISGAQAHVHKCDGLGKQPITVYLRTGTYYLEKAIVFSSKDSGTADAPVTYSSYKNEKAVISGGARLTLDWKPFTNGILQAQTPADLEMDQLFVNGIRQPMARYPNYNPNKLPYNGYAADAFSPARAERWADPTGGYIHAMHGRDWGGFHYRITGKQADNVVIYEGGWQNNRSSSMSRTYRFVENIFEELDAPGEWFHNRNTRTLYYFPAEDIDPNTATFEVARLKQLVEFQGTQKEPVKYVNLTGLIFRHAMRTFMETKEPLLRSDWTIYRGGAVTITGAEDCLLADCEFDQLGGNAIFVNSYNRRITVRGSHIHGAGASGVCFVGSPDSVRSPLFNYGQQMAYDKIDKTPGPKSDNHPADCVVEDSLIHDIGVVEKQAAGVQISMARGITVRHCSIYDVGRAGINISEGTFGGHVIEFCDVFDTVRETGDHGSFNSWGRDRFWHLKGAPDEKLPELALLDAGKTIIRNSRWRCDHGWDVDLDDGSSNYEIYNNVFLRGGLKLREGFHRRVYNNIAVNCSLHPHVWYKNSMDVVTHNIWMTKYRPALMDHWSKEIDRNLFLTEADCNAYASKGCDANSVWGDPMFVDPANGDYRVKEGSPALKLGFKNFPMDKFGVQKPELKAIARTPKLPILAGQKEVNATPAVQDGHWLGATVAALEGEAYSAFGVSKEDGGIHLVKVPETSAAAKAGFKAGDVVQRINGEAMKRTADLGRVTGKSSGKSIKVDFVRDQKEHVLTLKE